MFKNIRNQLPPKYRRFVKRVGRFILWVVAIAMSFGHIGAASREALRARVDSKELSAIRRMSACANNAISDVGTVISDSYISMKVGFRAFFQYFRNNAWAGLVLIYAIIDTILHVNLGAKTYRRWKGIKRAKMVQ